MRNLYSENAFTGLEAAIVLIAFVVVAAVFSYVGTRRRVLHFTNCTVNCAHGCEPGQF